ncbi:AbrB/MazE/SpoVT family DNA-binding domain-containing protein [Neorhizobium tomejilense]|uniref:AbrB/MazE/SpoVT family DNA-binding domain-containing protein n=1 Tax=Neorhizobium tomejilense TaxID=2093828 RepID=UPI003ED02F22
MPVTTKIRRQGGAAVITIPPALLKLMHTEVGDQLTLDVANGELIARPVESGRKRYTLSELLKGSDAMAMLNASVADAQEGDPIGHEI